MELEKPEWVCKHDRPLMIWNSSKILRIILWQVCCNLSVANFGSLLNASNLKIEKYLSDGKVNGRATLIQIQRSPFEYPFHVVVTANTQCLRLVGYLFPTLQVVRNGTVRLIRMARARTPIPTFKLAPAHLGEERASTTSLE